MQTMKPLLLVVFACLLTSLGARATVRMPALFGDHMVLQQETKLPVWGTADVGEKVTVTLGDHTSTAITDNHGKWRVDLKPFPATSKALTLTVAGSNTLTFQDVLVGDVWVASGQSNMEVPVNWMADAAQVCAAATETQLRVFRVEYNWYRAGSFVPKDDVVGHWTVCTPDVTNNFSAVAYFFGRELRAHLQRPVGIIGSYVGGTPAQAWISESGLAKAPPFANEINTLTAAKWSMDDYDQRLADAETAMDHWGDQVTGPDAAKLSDWKSASRLAARGNVSPAPAPPVSQPANPPPLPPDAEGDRHTPTVLFNGMIAPLIPYAMHGVIWYQGEDNCVVLAGAHEYGTLFPRLISDWREKWGQGDFPFLFVQLASFTRDDIHGPGGIEWAIGRESQAKALALPKTGMVTAVDIGAGADVHPRDKVDVGKRLALVARHVAYGEDLVYTGPTFDKATVEGKTIRVSFTHTGSGLIIGKAPWTAPNIEPTPDTSLVGFTISGADKKFVAADAKIDGNTVVLSSPQVAAPVAARYYWDNLTQANLYNKEGLPAFPFRSDAWDDVPSPANPPVMH
jgi:sialate O-acetylesterase